MRSHVMIYYQLYVNGLEKSINSMLRTQLHKMHTMGKVFYYFVFQQVYTLIVFHIHDISMYSLYYVIL